MIREANALLDDGGLSLDTDPRRVAKSGAAHARPAQSAPRPPPGAGGHARRGADPSLGVPLTQARLRRMMETGRYSRIDELAAAEKINSTYVLRLQRLTLLAPEIVEAILDGRQPENVTLPGLMEPFPVDWGQQRSTIGQCGTPSARLLRR